MTARACSIEDWSGDAIVRWGARGRTEYLHEAIVPGEIFRAIAYRIAIEEIRGVVEDALDGVCP